MARKKVERCKFCSMVMQSGEKLHYTQECEVVKLVKAGHKIEAMKKVQEIFRLPLRECKELVDQI